jgi:uncharacterized protein (TIGR02118 family)
MTTLLAIFRRPDGGDDAVATFLRRYREEHLPLIAATPGLRGTWVRETAQKLMGDDVLIVTGMEFDDRVSLDAALTSDAMKAGGRNLREIAPGIVTLLAMEDASELEAAAAPVPPSS